MKQCFVCGVVHQPNQYEYWDMTEVFNIYQVCSQKNLCRVCADTADSFVNYFGKKKHKDKIKLREFLINGVIPQKEFNSMMNAGYY